MSNLIGKEKGGDRVTFLSSSLCSLITLRKGLQKQRLLAPLPFKATREREIAAFLALSISESLLPTPCSWNQTEWPFLFPPSVHSLGIAEYL